MSFIIVHCILLMLQLNKRKCSTLALRDVASPDQRYLLASVESSPWPTAPLKRTSFFFVFFVLALIDTFYFLKLSSRFLPLVCEAVLICPPSPTDPWSSRSIRRILIHRCKRWPQRNLAQTPERLSEAAGHTRTCDTNTLITFWAETLYCSFTHVPLSQSLTAGVLHWFISDLK